MQPPWMEAIVGLTISSARFHASMHSRRNARSISNWPGSSASVLKSMPEENIGPAPRTTTQCTSGSLAAALSADPTSATNSPLNALRFSGRLRTTWRTLPRSSVSTIGISAA
jgi:hypothetical protein